MGGPTLEMATPKLGMLETKLKVSATNSCDYPFSTSCTSPQKNVLRRPSTPTRPHHRRTASDPTDMITASVRLAADAPKRTLGAAAPGESPAHKKLARSFSSEDLFSIADADIFFDSLSETSSTHEVESIHPNAEPSLLRQWGALSNAAVEYDESSRVHREALEPSADGSAKKDCRKDVPMWTVEEDLRILKLVEQHGA
eukprot:624171-Pleurochrysis_carterae.AAC.2